MSNARVNQISSGQLACVLIVFRLSTLVLSKSVAYTQLFAEILLTLALSAVAFIAYKKSFYPAKNFPVYVTCALLFSLVFLDVMQYFKFTSGVGSSDVPLWVTAVLLAVFTLYSGVLGTEAVSRFCVVSVVVAALFILLLTATNIADVRYDFFVANQNERINGFSLLKCFDVSLIFLLLAPDTAKKQGRALAFGTLIPYAAYAVIIMLCRAVLGKTAGIYKFPVFALFQLAEAGDFNKLDIMYVTLILLLLFCEISLTVSLFSRRIKKQVKK